MVKEFIELWEKNKIELRDYFKTTNQDEYDSYVKLFELVLNKIINNNSEYNFGNVRVLDDGDYQGTQVFIANLTTYQPSVDDYIYTNTYYGSCSGCDTLQAINDWEDGLPTEEQIEDYMTLCLHLVQKLKYMSDGE